MKWGLSMIHYRDNQLTPGDVIFTLIVLAIGLCAWLGAAKGWIP